MKHKKKAPFFIVGSDRSGTTLLRLMLNEHPNLRIPRESQFLMYIFDNFTSDSIISNKDLDNIYKYITAHPRWKEWGCSNKSLQDCIYNLHDPSVYELIDEIYRINLVGKSRWGDKTPIFIRYISIIAEIFVDSKFIHVVRDGRDVSISLKQTGWWGKNILKRAYYWKKSVRMFNEASNYYGNNRCLTVKYENIVLDPDKSLKEICEFIDESYTCKMRLFYKKSLKEIAPSEKKVHAKTMRPPCPADTFRWEKEMSKLDIFLFECMGGSMLDLYGYERCYQFSRPISIVIDTASAIIGPILLPVRGIIVKIFPFLKEYI